MKFYLRKKKPGILNIFITIGGHQFLKCKWPKLSLFSCVIKPSVYDTITSKIFFFISLNINNRYLDKSCSLRVE